MLTRLPATYAAAAAAFAETARLAPEFAPRRLLDAGAGPGGASWAALEAWPDLETVVQLDASGPFLAMAERLAADAPAPLREAERRRVDLTAPPEAWPAADLVVASYALAEIAPGRLGETVAGLWQACQGVLVLIEPGSPAGAARLSEARTALTSAGGAVLAPCPHDGACPIVAPDWCHFSQRLPRRRDHRIAKGGQAPFEDEKYAYLAVARPGVVLAPRSGRIIAPPKASKAGIEFSVCDVDGLNRRDVARRDKAGFAVARRLDWGDRFPPS